MDIKGTILRHKAASVVIAAFAVLLLGWLFCLPRHLFKGTEYSSVVTDRHGELLGARIAKDGQWRFPPCDSVPSRYATALIEFEDRHFRWHPGVDPAALGRAAWQNMKAGHIASGGSTITMQVIRMSRGKDRNLWQKAIEAIQATRLELRCSKDEILELYATHAPFGGNVVGLEAAAWRYFGRPADELSWGEAATLAVLPNAPGNIHVSKNRDKLLEKRNRLLGRLHDKGIIDDGDFTLACEEPLPDEPLPLPSYASHYVEMLCAANPGQRIRSSIDLELQKKVEDITSRWSREQSRSGVNDMAAVVMDVNSGEILSWVGNADPERKRSGMMVNVADAPRSSGSILKPFLYCAMLQDGEILPHTLLQDTPVNINGFTPQNFDLQYSGAVPASEALYRSLNIPSVHMLQQYGVPKFQALLQKAGMSTLTRDSSVYGLSLILGGGECKLWEITRIYADLAKWYQSDDSEIKSDQILKERFKNLPFYDRTAAWYTFEALSEVNRPDEIDWRLISSVHKVAWKTGTSWGFRDAWAVGATPDYAVGIWSGNAQGEGVPGLVGARTSGPVMFDIFNILPKSEWFREPPYGEYITAEVCRKSGYLSGAWCEDCDTLMLPKNAIRSKSCPYHRLVEGKTMFLLPPAMEWYYRQKHSDYVPMPSHAKGGYMPMEFIYPQNGSSMSIPKQMDGSVKGIVFNLAHSNPDKEVFWHLDSDYVGNTKYIHQLTLVPDKGKHNLTVVDSDGNSLSISFTIE